MTVDLSYFYETKTSESGESVLHQRVISHKSLSDILDMIAQNRQQSAIELHANLFASAEQWGWYDKYQQYLIDLNTANEHNNHLAIVSYDDDEQPIFAEIKTLPEIPPRPAIRTGHDVLEFLNYYSDKFKAKRSIAVESIKVTVDDMVFDGDEISQTRMSRAILGMKEAGITVIKWKLADNTVVDVSVKQLAKAMLLAGQEQTELWGMEDI